MTLDALSPVTVKSSRPIVAPLPLPSVWVSSGDRGALAVYDRRTGAVVRRLPADAPPQHVTFSGPHAYVTSGEDGTLRVLSLKDGRVVHTTKVPEGSYNVQEAFGWIVTPSLDRGTFCVLDRVDA